MGRGIRPEHVAHAARMYKTNADASSALGITMRSFGRLCRRHGIETPYVRKRRMRRAAEEGAVEEELPARPPHSAALYFGARLGR